MAAVTNLINLSKINVQHFPFQKPLINYIFENSSLILPQKLIKCCKVFKLLHLKMNESRINELFISNSSIKIDPDLSDGYLFSHNACRYKVNTTMKSIKILHLFEISCSDYAEYYLMNLMPKLDLSQTKNIILNVGCEIEKTALEKLLQPSLEKFCCYCPKYENVNPALMVFQRCPKIKEIQIYNDSFKPILNKNVFKKMLLTKRETKIKRINFISVSEVCQEDFMELMNNHLGSYCFVTLKHLSSETFNAFKEMCDRIKKIRQNDLKISNVRVNLLFETSDVGDSYIEIRGGLPDGYLSNKRTCRYKIDTIMKSIKILTSLEMYQTYYFDFYSITLLPKFDLSVTKIIKIYIQTEIKMTIWERILQTSLKIIEIMCLPSENVNPALMVFQKCPKIKEIHIEFKNTVPILTRKILKEILKTKRETRIEKLVLFFVSVFDQEDFLQLMNNHLAPNCYVGLSIRNREEFYELKRIFDNIIEIRENIPKSGIKIKFWCQGTAREISM